MGCVRISRSNGLNDQTSNAIEIVRMTIPRRMRTRRVIVPLSRLPFKRLIPSLAYSEGMRLKD